MKKSLIALAALATVGAAQAQSSVTVYGVLDAGYSDMEKTVSGVKQTQNAFTFSNYTTSRFGLRGTEDLGGGLNATFVVETGISSDVMAGFYQNGTANATVNNNATSAAAGVASGTAPQATTIGDRGLFATISSRNTGTTIGLGFASTSVRDIALKFDAAGGSRLIGNFITMDAALSSNRATGLAVTQNLGKSGVSVSAGLSQNESKTGTANEIKGRNGWSLGANYAQGDFEAGYTRQELKATRNDTNGVRDSDAKQTIDMAGASYDLKVAKVFLSHANIKLEDALQANGTLTAMNASTTAAATTSIFTGEGKRRFTSLGISAPVGKTTLFATVSEGKIDQAFTNVTGNVKRDMSGYTVGARYNFSKRTVAYGALGQAKIDGTSGNTNEVKVEQITAGIMHSF